MNFSCFFIGCFSIHDWKFLAIQKSVHDHFRPFWNSSRSYFIWFILIHSFCSLNLTLANRLWCWICHHIGTQKCTKVDSWPFSVPLKIFRAQFYKIHLNTYLITSRSFSSTIIKHKKNPKIHSCIIHNHKKMNLKGSFQQSSIHLWFLLSSALFYTLSNKTAPTTKRRHG